MRFQLSNASTEDAKEPPDPGEVPFSSHSNDTVTTLTNSNLSRENSRYYNLFHTQLKSDFSSPFEKDPVPELNYALETFNDISFSVFLPHLFTPSPSNYDDHIYEFVRHSDDKATKILLKELFQYHKIINNYPSEVVKNINIITSKYRIFYKPTFKVFSKSFLVLKNLLPSPEFHILISDITSMDWAHCGITNPHSITKITKFICSMNHTETSIKANNNLILRSPPTIENPVLNTTILPYFPSHHHHLRPSPIRNQIIPTRIILWNLRYLKPNYITPTIVILLFMNFLSAITITHPATLQPNFLIRKVLQPVFSRTLPFNLWVFFRYKHLTSLIFTLTILCP